jgi:hypothetical protein
MPPHLLTWARTLDLVGLDDDLALAVRHFLSRNRQLREPARSRLGHTLARQVAVVTNPPPPAHTAGWAYLAAVLAERHRRAALRLAQRRPGLYELHRLGVVARGLVAKAAIHQGG